MDIITIRRVSFGSFVKLCAVISLPMGITLGVIAFLSSLVGLNVQIDLGFSKIIGIPAGMAALPITPLVFTILGIVGGIVSYWPFSWFLNIIRGLKIAGKWNGS